MLMSKVLAPLAMLVCRCGFLLVSGVWLLSSSPSSLLLCVWCVCVVSVAVVFSVLFVSCVVRLPACIIRVHFVLASALSLVGPTSSCHRNYLSTVPFPQIALFERRAFDFLQLHASRSTHGFA